MNIPEVRVFRIRFRPSLDGRQNRISVYDCKTMAVHYIPYEGDAISMHEVSKCIAGFGLIVTGQFVYRGDEFVTTQPN